MKRMAANTYDSIVTDPPYELGFMNLDFDKTGVAFDPATWAEVLRVAKPGAFLSAFGGTRTYHRIACAIEDAGWEMRDSITLMWMYGCLSEDTEVLTRDGWELYHTAKSKEILTYDHQKDVYEWERPERWSEYRVESDTAFRITSYSTDQIVSRNHRCLVERGGRLTFVAAEELSDVERVPTLPDDFRGVSQEVSEDVQPGVQRVLPGAGLGEARAQGQSSLAEEECGVCQEEDDRQEQPGVEGRSDVLQTQGEVRGSSHQVRAVSEEVLEDGTQRRVRDGAPPVGCTGDRQTANESGVCSSPKSQSDGQQVEEPDAVQNECRTQEVRARASYRTTVANVTPIEYSGMIFCPTVSTGAFVARRNGQVFITGNSGFPKSLDIGKSIGEFDTEMAKLWDGWGTALKPAFEPIIVARKPFEGTLTANVVEHGVGGLNIDACRVGTSKAVPASPRRAPQGAAYGDLGKDPGTGSGWDTEIGRWPANVVLACACEGPHDPDCPVALLDAQSGALTSGKGAVKRAATAKGHQGIVYGKESRPEGTEMIGYDDSGGASRFFYTAKPAKSEKEAGLKHRTPTQSHEITGRKKGSKGQHNPRAGVTGGRPRVNIHPTVKPRKLMQWLVTLTTPENGLVLDPFGGSGTTGMGALYAGMRAHLIEMSPEYVSLAADRLREAAADTELERLML